MVIKLAKQGEGSAFTSQETDKRVILFAMGSASVLVNRQSFPCWDLGLHQSFAL